MICFLDFLLDGACISAATAALQAGGVGRCSPRSPRRRLNGNVESRVGLND